MKIGTPSVLAYVATITLLAVIPRPVAATPCMTAADQPTLVAACSGKSVGDPCASAGWVGSCQANPCGIADYDGQATPDILMCYLTSPDEADSGTSNEGGGSDATADTGTASDASTDAATEASLQTGPDAADSGSTPVVRSSGGGCSCKTAGDSPGNAAAATLGLAIALSVTFGMRRAVSRSVMTATMRSPAVALRALQYVHRKTALNGRIRVRNWLALSGWRGKRADCCHPRSADHA
jgi:hypothetical protein